MVVPGGSKDTAQVNLERNMTVIQDEATEKEEHIIGARAG